MDLEQKITKINLSLLKRCDQLWDDMSPNEKGRVCGKCKETLIDFRKLSDQKMTEINVFSDHKVCGVYTKEQLGLLISKPKLTRTKPVLFGVFAMLAATGISVQKDNAQFKQEQIEGISEAGIVSNSSFLESKSIVDDSMVIYGTLYDSENIPMPFGNVYVDGSRKGTTTDLEGGYILDLTNEFDSVDQLPLNFYNLGYEKQTIILNKQDFTAGRKEIDVILNEGVIISNYAVILPWNKRIWRKIKSKFKKR